MRFLVSAFCLIAAIQSTGCMLPSGTKNGVSLNPSSTSSMIVAPKNSQVAVRALAESTYTAGMIYPPSTVRVQVNSDGQVIKTVHQDGAPDTISHIVTLSPQALTTFKRQVESFHAGLLFNDFNYMIDPNEVGGVVTMSISPIEGQPPCSIVADAATKTQTVFQDSGAKIVVAVVDNIGGSCNNYFLRSSDDVDLYSNPARMVSDLLNRLEMTAVDLEMLN